MWLWYLLVAPILPTSRFHDVGWWGGTIEIRSYSTIGTSACEECEETIGSTISLVRQHGNLLMMRGLPALSLRDLREASLQSQGVPGLLVAPLVVVGDGASATLECVPRGG